MVSKAKDDLPEPERPVITINLSFGISHEIFFRLIMTTYNFCPEIHKFTS